MKTYEVWHKNVNRNTGNGVMIKAKNVAEALKQSKYKEIVKSFGGKESDIQLTEIKNPKAPKKLVFSVPVKSKHAPDTCSYHILYNAKGRLLPVKCVEIKNNGYKVIFASDKDSPKKYNMTEANLLVKELNRYNHKKVGSFSVEPVWI